MSIALRLSEIRSDIEQACARSGRQSRNVNILAVSKLQSKESIEEAYAAGIRDFGENYVQELLQKKKQLTHLTDIRWHLIGHLQTNKAKVVSNEVSSFHALDSEKLAIELNKRTENSLPVFIEVNIDNEPSKEGIAPEKLSEFIAVVGRQPRLKIEGLMCIPEHKEPIEMMRPAFKKLSLLAKSLRETTPYELKLSMGMSSDYVVAIEEGANWIRIGTKLFGERPQKR